jgi:hypothetical protein
MSALAQVVIALLGLIVSAQTRVTVLGHSVPVLWLVALSITLALAAAVLVLLRSMARDGWLWFRPRVVTL